MAKGYPDFFGYSVFPYYGDLLNQDVLVPGVVALDTATLFEISHKGILFGGYLYLFSTDAPPTDLLVITVDGSVVFSDSCLHLYWFGYTDSGSTFVCLRSLNYVDLHRTLEFNRQISFSTEFKVELTAGADSDITTIGRIAYTAIVT